MTTTPLTPSADPAHPTLQGRLDSYWSGRAADYHAHQVTGERAPLDRALWASVFGEVLGSVRTARGSGPLDILDVGTGSGYLATLLAEAGHRVTGIDHSPGMIAVAQASSSPAHFSLGDAHAPGLPEASVDAVVNRYVLWTLPDPVAAASAWRRALRPGGVVVAVDAAWFPHGVDPEMKVPSADGEDAFARTYDLPTLTSLPLGTAGTADEFAGVFRDAGFADVTVEDLPQVAELDRRFGVAPGHDSRPHFLVTARG
ncbi:class I SAM-dependent methyltransferase [Corynebacterium terpenotabidum]|uniref:Methyltransferase type 11 domain-containing protein n=1 Tax=Corynebacterium terpenotabidum Y-11 TaxID=1200352 RepID=S4XGY2_9CORY|nr:class I SAM-dependent methyltransferase [Corynebacterium terpenotabidum]AGP31844.1 hypothetical protein A606_11025 [Corynebacterium terpenotabidum Y-11]